MMDCLQYHNKKLKTDYYKSTTTLNNNTKVVYKCDIFIAKLIFYSSWQKQDKRTKDLVPYALVLR